MNPTAESLIQAVLSLPESERIVVASTLLDSFANRAELLNEADPEFDTELDRRIDEYEAGRMVPISGKEFFDALRAKQQ